MPYDLKLEPRGFCATYSGIVAAEDILGVMHAIEGHPRFDDLLYGISDYLDIRGHTVSRETLFVAAARWKGAARTNPDVFLVSVARDPAVVALIKSFEGLRLSPYRRAIVASVAEARTLLEAELGRDRVGVPLAGA